MNQCHGTRLAESGTQQPLSAGGSPAEGVRGSEGSERDEGMKESEWKSEQERCESKGVSKMVGVWERSQLRVRNVKDAITLTGYAVHVIG